MLYVCPQPHFATCTLKVTAFGFPMLNGIDPKPDNIVAGAILHTTRAQVGALLRAEPNAEAQVCIHGKRRVRCLYGWGRQEDHRRQR